MKKNNANPAIHLSLTIFLTQVIHKLIKVVNINDNRYHLDHIPVNLTQNE